jgi:acyl dehydratase
VADTDREFEEATNYALQERDVDAAKALVGVETPNRSREQLTVATPDAIRNYARAVGDDNPLWHDVAYGLTTRWGSQIASPSMTTILNTPMKGDRAPQGLRRPSFRGIHVFVSGGSSDWYRPVYPGDSLYSYQGLESVEVKQSEFADRSVVQLHRTVKLNQRGEVVAILRLLAIYTERKTARDRGKYAQIEPAVYSDADIADIDAVYAAEGPRGADRRWWEDVHVGDTLPAMAKGPLTETEIMVFHSGGYGFVPYAPSASRIGYKNRQRIPKFYVKNEFGIPDVAQRVHWDSAWAQAIGNPMAYDYGVMRESWLTHYLTDWIGDDGWIVRQNDEVRKFNYIGDTQIITGTVVGKYEESGRGHVDIEMRATNQRGVVTAPGHATVLLPSREHGPVRLPTAPDAVQQKATDMFSRHCELGGMAPWANLTPRP